MKLRSICGFLLVLGIAFSYQMTHSAPSATLPTGKIMGVILDANNARVVNATIKAEGGKIKRTVQSSDQGKFEISLPPGSYELTVEANGFRRFIFSPLEVKPNQTEMINIHLEVAPPPGLTPASSNRTGLSSSTATFRKPKVHQELVRISVREYQAISSEFCFYDRGPSLSRPEAHS